MACKLYLKLGQDSYYIGTFRNKKKAQTFYKATEAMLKGKMGKGIEPIYVETGKGKGK